MPDHKKEYGKINNKNAPKTAVLCSLTAYSVLKKCSDFIFKNAVVFCIRGHYNNLRLKEKEYASKHSSRKE